MDFDLTKTAVREWVTQSERDTGARSDGGLTSTERQELSELQSRASPSGLHMGSRHWAVWIPAVLVSGGFARDGGHGIWRRAGWPGWSLYPRSGRALPMTAACRPPTICFPQPQRGERAEDKCLAPSAAGVKKPGSARETG
jgi:hypothetical protein